MLLKAKGNNFRSKKNIQVVSNDTYFVTIIDAPTISDRRCDFVERRLRMVVYLFVSSKDESLKPCQKWKLGAFLLHLPTSLGLHPTNTPHPGRLPPSSSPMSIDSTSFELLPITSKVLGSKGGSSQVFTYSCILGCDPSNTTKMEHIYHQMRPQILLSH